MNVEVKLEIRVKCRDCDWHGGASSIRVAEDLATEHVESYGENGHQPFYWHVVEIREVTIVGRI